MNQKKSIIFTLLLTVTGLSHATLLPPLDVSATGVYNNELSLIIDGTFPAESTDWTAATNVHWSGVLPVFTIDLGNITSVNDVLLSVDNNDDYSVEWSSDSISWNSLFSISSGNGEVTWGMDTMSTDNSNSEYVSELDFSPVDAQYIRIFATGGDSLFSIGEVQISGNSISNDPLPSAVPVPATFWLFSTALLGFSGIRKKTSK